MASRKDKLKAASSYKASSIVTRKGLDIIRESPGVYLGENMQDTALREVGDNAFDEVVRGFADTVEMIVHDDGSFEFRDNGRGIPVDWDSEDNVNGIVKSVGTPTSGSNFESGEATGGVHGIGASATNAISERFSVRVFRDGKEYRQDFRKGKPVKFKSSEYNAYDEYEDDAGRKLVGRKEKDASDPDYGTYIRFTFDNMFITEDDKPIDVDSVVERFDIMAMLTPGANFFLTRDGERVQRQSASDDSGTSRVMDYMLDGKKPSIELDGEFSFKRTVRDEEAGSTVRQDTDASYSLSVAPDTEPKVVATTNSILNPGGGSHYDALLEGLGEGLSSTRVRNIGQASGEPYPSASDFANVVAGAVAVRVPKPKFTSQEKYKMSETALRNALRDDIRRKATLWAASPANRDELTKWAKQALEGARIARKLDDAREQARKQKRNTSGLGVNLTMPEGYVPCRVTGRGSGAELHICEGKSALGTIRGSRFSEFQAAYALRGKPVKTYRKSIRETRKNVEFAELERILGCGVRENCDPEKCRFDRIFLTCDADPDGYNINASLMVMFRENFRPLIEAGMVYVSLPPLFIVTLKNKASERVYCVDEDERDEAVQAFIESGRAKDASGVNVQRCKGLGEMNTRDFKETVMDPRTRNVIRVLTDEEDDAVVEISFGENAERKRKWIADETRMRDISVSDVMH